MTAKQLEQIAALRRENYPYSFIGRELGLSPNNVKSICRRKRLEAVGSRKTKAEKQKRPLCRYCHKPLRGTVRRERCFAQITAAPNGAESTGRLSRSSLDSSGKQSDEWYQEVRTMRIEEIPAKPKEQKIIRVAAYARVSSDKDSRLPLAGGPDRILP